MKLIVLELCKLQVEAQGVQINCPYSTFTDEDGFFDSEIIDYTPGLRQAMHLGVLAHMVKVLILPTKRCST